MKELEKVKRISIASTLFILAVLIGVLTFERPKNTYAINTKDTLKKLTNNNDYIVSLNDINNPDVVLIDVRSAYEYDKGHLTNAINISTPEILSDENQSIFSELKNTNKTVVLYGNSPEEANIPFLLLYQMGYDTIKLLAVTNKYSQNKLITNEVNIEKYNTDIKSFIEESIKNVDGDFDIKETKIIPKKIITIKKKKKRAAEGGC